MHPTNPDDLDGPTSHSELLKVDYDRVMRALYREMTRFCTPGVQSGVAEVAALLDRNAHALRHQFGPTCYDHAPTVHAFLQVIEALRAREAVEAIAALADCTTIPRSPTAKAVKAPASDAAAFAELVKRARDIELTHPAFQPDRTQPLTQQQREQTRDALFDLIAYTAHLIARLS
jgi:hypothetical protein